MVASPGSDEPHPVSSEESPPVTECYIYVVDDDQSVRKSISWLFGSSNYQTRCYPSAHEFLENYDPRFPSCLLLDVRMPGASGLQLQSMLAERQINVPIIFVSGHADVQIASEAFRAGACDVLTKPVDVDLLMERVQEALEVDKKHHQEAGDTLAKKQLLEKLTPKEREVFQELLKGRTIKQLAKHFEVTFQTAAKHRSRVLEKLDVDTDARLIRSYQNWLQP